MSNDPLVKQLRDCVALAALCYEAADMIEELSAKLEQAMEALVRIEHVSDLYSVEANAEDQGADTLAYAHKSICNLARTTLAELKGETK